uniref:Endonuclease/exonuclease/phosphatase domain-containing protein n=1 Tax=Gouania willdenowi TaxID=441366 RepID=A0A8C5GE47_GOUWI
MWPGTRIADGTRFVRVRFTDADGGRLLVVEGLKKDRRYRLINIYAPNKVMEWKRFFGVAGRWCNNDTIMMGDFNVILTSDDVSDASKFFPDSSRSLIYKLLKERNMVDIWRVLNPKVKAFSRMQVVQGRLKRSRIDFWLSPILHR